MAAPVESVEETAGYAEYVRWWGGRGPRGPLLPDLGGVVPRKGFDPLISTLKGWARKTPNIRVSQIRKLTALTSFFSVGGYQFGTNPTLR